MMTLLGIRNVPGRKMVTIRGGDKMNRRELLFGTAATVVATVLPSGLPVVIAQNYLQRQSYIFQAFKEYGDRELNSVRLIESAEEMEQYFGPSEKETEAAQQFFGSLAHGMSH
jgi:hypothetical protein